jgi:Kef-type K+ transport system membrane component KefB
MGVANPLVHVLLALVVIIALARAVGRLLYRFGQPAVIGEILAGVMLGPSVLGQLSPLLRDALLPAEVAPHLRVIAEIGVIFFMFLVGIELDVAQLRARGRAAIAVSHASIAAPFGLGALLALWLFPRWAPRGVDLHTFVLFVGVAMSVTAFPVLARILTDRGMHGTSIAAVAMTCAAVDDVTAWCLLAFLVGWVHAEPGAALITVALSLGFVAIVLRVVQVASARLEQHCEQRGALGQGMFALVCVVVLLAAATTELIGIHALFGAFLVGVTIPPTSRLARELRARLADAVVVLLLPSFFTFTGMRTELGLLTGARAWLTCGAVIAVAAGGKLGGAAVAARVTGSSWRQALTLGVLLNTRGLMELIVLNIGLDLGVLSPTLFTMFVVMALVTTAATAPLLSRLTKRESSRS